MTTTDPIVIPLLNVEYTGGDTSADNLKEAVRRCGVHASVGCVNWPEFPYTPCVEACLAHDGTRLFCLFTVNEKHLLARALDDHGPVWKDSCVEVFIADPDGTHYYNFETNAIGTALASRRESRSNYERLTAEQMQRIVRLSSLPREAVSVVNEDGGNNWSLLVGIPFDLIGCDGCPEELRLNLYKCGDETATPHFLSWAPISTPAPDFHRPEFFATVKFQQNQQQG